MDADRFDTLTRLASTAGSRRRAVVTAGGGMLALLGLAEPHDALAKKKCPPCKKRKQRKCKKKRPDGTACAGGTCQSGRCVAAPAAPFCQGKADFTDCGNGMKCSGGVCAPPPGCFNTGCITNGQCCSGFCSCIDGPPPDGICDTTGICAFSSTGQPCNRDLDCSSLNCVGFVCQAA
jgi:hypothetical protein